MKPLKILGLTALMALTLVASLGATSASAAKFKAGKYPVTIKGATTTALKFKGSEQTFTCASAEFSGSATEDSKWLMVAPSLSNCKYAGVVPVSVKTNGCEFAFYAESNFLEEGYPPFPPSMGISPEKCGGIEFTYHFVYDCTWKILPQFPNPVVTFKGTGEGSKASLLAELGVFQLSYQILESPSCKGVGIHGDMTVGGNISLSAFSGKEQVSLKFE